jgi:hypothetical protein
VIRSEIRLRAELNCALPLFLHPSHEIPRTDPLVQVDYVRVLDLDTVESESDSCAARPSCGVAQARRPGRSGCSAVSSPMPSSPASSTATPHGLRKPKDNVRNRRLTEDEYRTLGGMLREAAGNVSQTLP